MTAGVKLYKIFYDDDSFAAIAPPFEPLDNRDGPRSWFELHPILRYLETTELEPDTWYGFLSPKFPGKAGIELDAVYDLLSKSPDADVALFSSNWVSIIWSKNVWTYGDESHPGLMERSEAFLRAVGNDANLGEIIGTFENSVNSNYIVAKREFWIAWRDLARSYVDHVDRSGPNCPDLMPTTYTARSGQDTYQLMTFVQERLSCWLLASNRFEVVHHDYIGHARFPGDMPVRYPRLARKAWAASYGLKRLWAASGSGIARKAWQASLRVAYRLTRL
jgi:hypothetical protein